MCSLQAMSTTWQRVQRVLLVIPPSGYIPAMGWDEIAAAPLEGATIACTVLREDGLYVEAHDLRYRPDAQYCFLSDLRPSDCLCLASYPPQLQPHQESIRPRQTRNQLRSHYFWWPIGHGVIRDGLESYGR